MAAFPATNLLLSNYQTFVSSNFTGPSGAQTEWSNRPFTGYKVLYHSSVKRTAGSPKYLPESYALKRISYGLHTSVSKYGFWGVLCTQVSCADTSYWGFPVSWDWNADTLQSPSMSSAVKNRLLEKTLDKLKQDQANVSVDVIEARQTLRLIKSLVSVKKAAEEFERAMRKKGPYRPKRKYVVVYDHNGNPTKERRYFDSPGSPGRDSRRAAYLRDKWMETRYGVRPLVSSIFDTMKALLNIHLSGAFTIKVSTHRENETIKTVGLGSNSSPSGRYYIHQDVRGYMVSRFRIPANASSVQDFFSLNPVGWAWEAMPLSFVADWFVNVGQTIQNWEDWFRFASYCEGSMTTLVTKEVRQVSYYGYSSSPVRYTASGRVADGTYVTSRNGSVQCIFTEKVRSVQSSLPTPCGPSVRVNLDSAKIVDLCSIISQKLRSVR